MQQRSGSSNWQRNPTKWVRSGPVRRRFGIRGPPRRNSHLFVAPAAGQPHLRPPPLRRSPHSKSNQSPISPISGFDRSVGRPSSPPLRRRVHGVLRLRLHPSSRRSSRRLRLHVPVPLPHAQELLRPEAHPKASGPGSGRSALQQRRHQRCPHPAARILHPKSRRRRHLQGARARRRQRPGPAQMQVTAHTLFQYRFIHRFLIENASVSF